MSSMSIIVADIFPKRLKELRLLYGYTQQQIAELLHIKQQSYIRYEYGTGDPNLQTLVILSEICNVSVDYLLGKENIFNSLKGDFG